MCMWFLPHSPIKCFTEEIRRNIAKDGCTCELQVICFLYIHIMCSINQLDWIGYPGYQLLSISDQNCI